MKKLFIFLLASALIACASTYNSSENAASGSHPAESSRYPNSSADLTGTYLGEGLFKERTSGIKRPAMRLYLERVEGETNAYYGVLVEYDRLLLMAFPFISAQKAPVLNKMFGYLDKIATRVSAYKFIPGSQPGTYTMHNLQARNGQIVASDKASMTLTLNLKIQSVNKLAGASIQGNQDGEIQFPDRDEPSEGFVTDLAKALSLSEYKLASAVYSLGKLQSTWRGNFRDLEGSYLSEYGRVKDGVLELYNQSGKSQAQFIKTNRTKAKDFTNPKSAEIQGFYSVTEPLPKMFVLNPANSQLTKSDMEMLGRIGLFLDIFDASAQGNLVTELVFTNPEDPEDFMMYYQHPDHLKKVGVEPAKK